MQIYTDTVDGGLSEKKEEQESYRLLVPVGNPATEMALLQTAIAIAHYRHGEVIVLNVIKTEKGAAALLLDRINLENKRLDALSTLGAKMGVTVSTRTVTGTDIAEAIITEAETSKVNLIVLGWSGRARLFAPIMGAVLDEVLAKARCDILVYKPAAILTARALEALNKAAKASSKVGEDAAEEDPDFFSPRQLEPLPSLPTINSILVPVDNTPHISLQGEIAVALAYVHDSVITAQHVCPAKATPADWEEGREIIAKTFVQTGYTKPLVEKVLAASNVLQSILPETREHDVTIMGVAQVGFLKRLFFGSLAEQIARRSDHIVILVERRVNIV